LKAVKALISYALKKLTNPQIILQSAVSALFIVSCLIHSLFVLKLQLKQPCWPSSAMRCSHESVLWCCWISDSDIIQPVWNCSTTHKNSILGDAANPEQIHKTRPIIQKKWKVVDKD